MDAKKEPSALDVSALAADADGGIAANGRGGPEAIEAKPG